MIPFFFGEDWTKALPLVALQYHDVEIRIKCRDGLAPVTQPKVYAREMGGDSCGRLRYVVIFLDPDQLRKVPFEERLVPRMRSDEVLTETLRSVLVA